MRDFAPQRISGLDLFGFLLLTLAQSFLSLTVHVSNDNIFSFLVWTSCVILFSQMVYTSVTSSHYLRYMASFFLKKSSRNTAQTKSNASRKPTESLKFSVGDAICNASYFESENCNSSVRVTRGDMWRIQHPFALGVFGAFVCIPAYDASCTCMMALGLLLRGIYDEYRRGREYQRPITRRVVFTVVGLFGFLSCFVLFFFAYSVGVASTNKGLQAFINEKLEHENDLYETLQSINISSLSDETTSTAYNDTAILERFLDTYTTENKDMVQYVRWGAHSYPTKMLCLWLMSFCVCFLLESSPRGMTRPLLLESSQNSVSLIAAVNLCLVSVLISNQPFLLLQTSTASSAAYLLMSPIMTWLVIAKLLQYQLKRCLCAPVSIMLFVSYAKHCVQHKSLLRTTLFDDIAIVGGILVILFVFFTMLFTRMEMVALRSGWGGKHGGLSGMDSLPMSEMNSNQGDDEDVDYDIEENVQSILENAKRELAEVQKEMDEEET